MDKLIAFLWVYIKQHPADLIQSLTVIIAAISVILGVSAWRREHVGRRRIELAEDVLSEFYEANDIIRYMRSAFSYSGEGTSRKAAKDETPEEKRIYDSAYVIIERYELNKEVFNKIKSLRYRFMVLFGKDKAMPFNDLKSVIFDILASARRLSQLWLQQERERHFAGQKEKEELRKQVEKFESIFWEMPIDEDPILPRLDGIIEEIETHCRSIIEHPRVSTKVVNVIVSCVRSVRSKAKLFKHHT